MFQIKMLQGVLPIYSIEIKIQCTDYLHTPLIMIMPLDLVDIGFFITWLAHRQPPERGFIIPEVFTVRIISVYFAHMIDIFYRISSQLRWNTTPIGFSRWVEVLIKINWNWMPCCKLAQFGGELLHPTTSKLLNCDDFRLPIIFYTGRS